MTEQPSEQQLVEAVRHALNPLFYYDAATDQRLPLTQARVDQLEASARLLGDMLRSLERWQETTKSIWASAKEVAHV